MVISGELHAPSALPSTRTHWITGWVAPRADLNAAAKRRIR